jgi:hypothetical protein
MEKILESKLTARWMMATAMLASIAGCAVQSGYETDEVYGYPAQEPYYYGPAYGTVYGGTIWYQDDPDRRRYVDRNRNGIPDVREVDRNRNGIPDVREADRNHNGIPDSKEAAPGKTPEKNGGWSRPPVRSGDATPRINPKRDLDRDGIPNRRDSDRDGDGVPNSRDRNPSDRDRK